MNTTAPRTVLDTNIHIASIGRKSPYRWIFNAIIEGRIILVFSNDILLEYEEILAQKTTTSIAQNVVNFLTVSPNSEQIEFYFKFGLIEADDSDNKFVDCAVGDGADFLVSNDRHFNKLREIEFPKINLVNLVEFEAEFRPVDS